VNHALQNSSLASAEKRADVRVLAATNVNLQERIETGAFRKDLYFRISSYEIELKPLRERREDVELFIAHFLKRFAGELKISAPALTPEAHQALRDYDYPGNIRELKSIIERALIESGGKTIEESHLHLLNERSLVQSGSSASLVGRSSDDLPLNLEQAEIELVKRALAEAEGNVSKAAQLLGINRTKVYHILTQAGRGG
jgi:DNA-binding NtrC family response regulator